MRVFLHDSDCQFVWAVCKFKEMAHKTFSPHMYITDPGLDMLHHAQKYCVDF